MKQKAKKSLALFLTVLMLMTSWVFVAPNKASAVNSGTYYWRVRVNSSNDTGGWDYGRWYVKGKANNGKGSESQIGNFNQNINFKENGRIVGSGSSTSFPTKVEFQFSFGGGITHRKMDAYIYLDVSSNNSSWKEIASTQCYSYEWGTNKGTKTATVSTSNYPKANAVTFSTSPSNVTIPKSSNTSTSFATYLTDQYGVKVSSSASGYTKSVSLASNRNSTTGISASYGTTNTTADPGTVSVANSAKLLNENSNQITVTSSYTFNGVTKTASKSFTITDPQYTFTYNGNGGTVSPTSYKAYYGDKATSIPTTFTRTGYEAIGMYTSAKADSNLFTKPVAGSGDYANQLTTSTTILADTTYYAAWWAKNVTATFTDANGNVLATVTGKYGKTLDSVAHDAIAAIAKPAYHNNPSESGSTFKYVFDHWAIDTAVDQSGKDISGIIGGMDPAEAGAILQGNITVKPVYEIEKNKYTVSFHEVDGNVLTKSDYVYRDEAQKPADQSASSGTDAFGLEFAGWTQTPTDSFHVVDVNGNDVETGNYVAVATDFTVRGDADYYPVFVRTYKVTFVGADGVISENVYKQGETAVKPADPTKDADETYTYSFSAWTKNGEEAADLTVTENTTYVAVFEETYIDYVVTVTDKYGINQGTQTLHYGDEISFTPVFKKDGMTYTFTGWADGTEGTRTCKGTETVEAVYNAKPAVYDIVFVDFEKNETNIEVNHGEKLPNIPEVPATIIEKNNEDDIYDDVKYTFKGFFDEDGNAPSTETAITADAVYTAKYDSEEIIPVNYYVDGNITFQSAAFKGDAVPAYGLDEPTKDDDVYSRNYVFGGFFNKDGEAVSVMPNEELNLYAKFIGETVYYNVTFLQDDGSVISEAQYKYGETIEVPTAEKAEDASFSYEFKSWDPDLSTVCKDNASYTAVYRKHRVLYEVNFKIDGEVVRTQNFINGAKIVPPMNPTSNQPIDDKHEWKFVGWQIEGTDQMYDGDRIDGTKIENKTMTYVAVFEPVGKAYTVTFMIGDEVVQAVPGVTLGTILETLSVKAEKQPTSQSHFRFARWVDGNGRTVDLQSEVESDLTLYAEFTAEAHEIHTTVLTAPTFFQKGESIDGCEACGFEFDKADIDVLKDTYVPTGVLKIEGKEWSEPTSDGKVTTVSTSSFITINTEDKAEPDARFNPDGNGSGVAKIEIAVSETVVPVAEVSDWITLAVNNTSKTNFNFNEVLSETKYLKNATDGTTFALYVRVTDKLGLSTTFNSSLITVDEKAPEITVSETNTLDKDKACNTVTVSVYDATLDKVTVKKDGKVIEASQDGTYSEVGKYEIIATDIVGNESRKTFAVVSHDFAVHTEKPGCSDDGVRYEQCMTCSIKKNETVLPATGDHKFAGEGKHFDAVCNNNGYTLNTCTVCGNEIKIYDDPATEGHNFIETGRTESTCAVNGVVHKLCTVCGETRDEVLPLDKTKHQFTVIEKVDAEIGKEGYVKEQCTVCGEIKVTTLPALSSFKFRVVVYDAHGEKVKGAVVSVYDGNKLIYSGVTAEDGFTSLRVSEEKTYTFVVEVDGKTAATVQAEVKNKLASSTVTINLPHSEVERDCPCRCHKSGFIAAIFRFVHKIEKLFTGSYGCCHDPDERYGK